MPEPLTPFAQRSMYQAMRGLTGRVFRTLRRERDSLPEPLQQEAEELLGREEELLGALPSSGSAATRRDHDPLPRRLPPGQVLVAGDDVAIIDFEGEPSCPLAERRLKRPPLRDVASMLRSFAYAADAGRWDHSEDGMEPGEVVRPDLEPSARNWQLWTSAAFLREYLDAVDPQLIPPSREDLAVLLDVFLLEKAVYQLGHELRTRPAWVGIPLRGLGHLLAAPDPAQGPVRRVTCESGIDAMPGGSAIQPLPLVCRTASRAQLVRGGYRRRSAPTQDALQPAVLVHHLFHRQGRWAAHHGFLQRAAQDLIDPVSLPRRLRGTRPWRTRTWRSLPRAGCRSSLLRLIRSHCPGHHCGQWR